MLSLWHPHLFLALWLTLSYHVTVLFGGILEETRAPGTQTVFQPPQRSHGSDLVTGIAMLVNGNTDSLSPPVSRPSPSSREMDTQGVLGEYSDMQESSDELLLYRDRTGLRPTDNPNKGSATENTPAEESASRRTPPLSLQEQTLRYESAKISTFIMKGSMPYPTQTDGGQPILDIQNETPDGYFPLVLFGTLASKSQKQEPTSPPSAEPGLKVEDNTPTVAAGRQGWTTAPAVATKGEVEDHTGKDESKDEDQQVSKTSVTRMLDMDLSITPCETSNHTLTPIYPDDFTPNEPPQFSLAISPAHFIPLYSDWNSALATWGFAWEAHIYGLGSVFSVFGLLSVVCLLGLPVRCPAGCPYIILLHLLLLAFAGMTAFCMLYDAYNHQDRLPPLGSLLLFQLPYPCLTSAFSLAFLLLTLHSRKRLSLPLAISTTFSALPKPCLLLCMSLFHFGVSLGCVGILQLFPSLPTMMLLLPQGVLVCLTVFLSCSYAIFSCLIQVDTKNIYRLNDNGESGGSPEVMQPTDCPFDKEEDWGRAAGAGIGASLCFLGCGGLQLYGILHALGLGGVNGYGLTPWPWWIYQTGCRLCEIGVCLGLSLIGAHPLFCRNKSIKIISRPGPARWSRLSCGSPSRGLIPASQGDREHNTWPQAKQETVVVCDVITRTPERQSEAIPLCSVVYHHGNGQGPKVDPTKIAVPHLPAPPSPPHDPKDASGCQLSSLTSLSLAADSTVDLRPPSPIDLSRSIDQALFSESLFSHSIFGPQRLFNASSSLSLISPSQGTSNQGPSSLEDALYRTSSCGDLDKENTLSSTRPPQPHDPSQNKPEQLDWKGSVSGSTLGLCSKIKEKGNIRSHSWANRGQHFPQGSLPRAIPHLSYHRRYRTLSVASHDSQGSGRLSGTKQLSESKQLEWDIAVQAEFVSVCRQIDALSICSDIIEL